MIHLSISDSHLLCLQWSENNGKPILLSVSNKALPKPLNLVEQSENEIISVINAGLHLVREDISFEGQQVYVTIPDFFTNSVFVSSDEDMTENDTWDFALWSIKQRWPSDTKVEIFGRSFGENSNNLYAISISTTFTEPIKMAIQELGGEPIWMGTESSVFYGLNPTQGCTVFFINKTGYNYYQFSQSSFQSGVAKYLKGKWKILPLNGSANVKKVFKGQLLVAGNLSEKRKVHFKGNRIKQLVSLTGVNYEADILPKDVKEDNLYVFTALATGTVIDVSINFFDQPGIQAFNYVKKEIEKPVEIKKVKGSSNKRKKSKKTVKKKRDGFGLKIFLYFFFFITIAGMLVYDQKPEIFNRLFSKIDDFKLINYSTVIDTSSLDLIEEIQLSPEIVTDGITPVSKLSIKSQNLILTALNTLTLTDSHEIILLSISDETMDLELLGGKTMNAPIDSIGDVLNYSLRQVPGDSRFKHGYLVKYKSSYEFLSEGTLVEMDSLRTYVEQVQNSLFKVLNVIDSDLNTQTPIIIRLNGDNYIQTFLNYVLSKTKNLVLEKFVYKGKTTETLPTAVFYMSIYSDKNSNVVD